MVIPVLFPLRCVGCGRRGTALCPPCLAGSPRAHHVLPSPPLAECHALFAYAGCIRDALTHLKYRNERAATGALADALSAALPGSARRVDAVTWVPTTADRRRQRGFDHAELLARALARRLRLPARRLLVRLDARPQTGRTRAERLAGPVLRATGSVPSRVAVVDDVTTTGATLLRAADALSANGCKWVIGVAVARTPLKGPAARPDTRPRPAPAQPPSPAASDVRRDRP